MNTLEEMGNGEDSSLNSEQSRMMKASVTILVLSGINNFLQSFTSQSKLNHASSIVWILTLAWAGFELWTAWGLWNMKEIARKSFIAILIISALILLFNPSGLSIFGGASIIVLLVGLGLRCYFIYWYLDNEQIFSE